MRHRLMAVTAVLALSVPVLMAGTANAAPLVGIGPETQPGASLVQNAQLYAYDGRNYCWYGDGWRGPGYYWCGYSWRRGYGWGGGYGWNGWGRSGYAYRVAPGPSYFYGGYGRRRY